jgi:hypothetical protein
MLQVDIVSTIMVPPDLHIDLPSGTRENGEEMPQWKRQSVVEQPIGHQTSGPDLNLGVYSVQHQALFPSGSSQFGNVAQLHVLLVQCES